MYIGEVARLAKITTATIRFYEAEHLLVPAERRSGRRFYTEAATERLRLIAGLQGSGFSIREIRDLLRMLDSRNGLSRAWHARAHSKLEELDEAIARIHAARRVLRAVLACGCESAADCAVIAGWRASTG